MCVYTFIYIHIYVYQYGYTSLLTAPISVVEEPGAQSVQCVAPFTAHVPYI